MTSLASSPYPKFWVHNLQQISATVREGLNQLQTSSAPDASTYGESDLVSTCELLIINMLEEIYDQGARFTAWSSSGNTYDFGSTDLLLTFDPLSGIGNAQRQLADYGLAITVSAARNVVTNPTRDKIRCALVCDLATGHEWVAIKGHGAFYNGSSIEPHISDFHDRKFDVVVTGDTSSAQLAAASKAFSHLASHVRTTDVPAIALCQVALGTVDAFASIRDCSASEVSASSLVLSESGCALWIENYERLAALPLTSANVGQVVAAGDRESLLRMWSVPGSNQPATDRTDQPISRAKLASKRELSVAYDPDLASIELQTTGDSSSPLRRTDVIHLTDDGIDFSSDFLSSDGTQQTSQFVDKDSDSQRSRRDGRGDLARKVVRSLAVLLVLAGILLALSQLFKRGSDNETATQSSVPSLTTTTSTGTTPTLTSADILTGPLPVSTGQIKATPTVLSDGSQASVSVSSVPLPAQIQKRVGAGLWANLGKPLDVTTATLKVKIPAGKSQLKLRAVGNDNKGTRAVTLSRKQP